MATEESIEPAAPAVAAEAVSGPGDWVVPVACFHCQREYPIAARHFRTGAVLCCPHCHGAYVVTRGMYGDVSDVVQEFEVRCHAQSPEVVRATGDACTAGLRDLVRGFRPPGAPRRRASMFG